MNQKWKRILSELDRYFVTNECVSQEPAEISVFLHQEFPLELVTSLYTESSARLCFERSLLDSAGPLRKFITDEQNADRVSVIDIHENNQVFDFCIINLDLISTESLRTILQRVLFQNLLLYYAEIDTVSDDFVTALESAGLIQFESEPDFFRWNDSAIIGEQLYRRKAFDAADKWFLSLLSEEPGNVRVLNNLGVIDWKQGNLDKAETLFKKVIALDQHYPDALWNYARLLIDSDRLEEAGLFLEQHKDIAGAHPDIRDLLLQCQTHGDTALQGSAEQLDRQVAGVLTRVKQSADGIPGYDTEQSTDDEHAVIDRVRLLASTAEPDSKQPAERRLHIGGKEIKTGWEIFNALDGPGVDHTGNAKDLSRFPDNCFTEIYASHVVEHFSYAAELLDTLREWRRVLVPEGRLSISVPDLNILASLLHDQQTYSMEQRFYVMRMLFGGQTTEYDFHKVGLNKEFLTWFLQQAGFHGMARVDAFGIFNDTSSKQFEGVQISLNMVAYA